MSVITFAAIQQANVLCYSASVSLCVCSQHCIYTGHTEPRQNAALVSAVKVMCCIQCSHVILCLLSNGRLMTFSSTTCCCLQLPSSWLHKFCRRCQLPFVHVFFLLLLYPATLLLLCHVTVNRASRCVQSSYTCVVIDSSTAAAAAAAAVTAAFFPLQVSFFHVLQIINSVNSLSY